jgi:hypothetical protein
MLVCNRVPQRSKLYAGAVISGSLEAIRYKDVG